MPSNSEPPMLLDNSSSNGGGGAATAELSNQKFAAQNKTALTPTGAVIVFDWDDTLLPSTFVSARGLKLDDATTPAADLAEFKPVEEAAVALLSTAIKFGPVYIITNAETGWVELSSAKWMPSVVPLLPHVTVISARSTFEAEFPSSPLDWKLQSFFQVVDEYATADMDAVMAVDNAAEGAEQSPLSLLSLGDSIHEREAAHSAVLNTRMAVTTVKFVERPNPCQLRREIQQVASWFSHLIGYNRDLDLVV